MCFGQLFAGQRWFGGKIKAFEIRFLSASFWEKYIFIDSSPTKMEKLFRHAHACVQSINT